MFLPIYNNCFFSVFQLLQPFPSHCINFFINSESLHKPLILILSLIRAFLQTISLCNRIFLLIDRPITEISPKNKKEKEK